MTLQDFKFAGRTLRKSPIFTLTAVITIALGVGASTAIFSVMNAVLLKPLPYHNPSQLVVACSDMTVRHVRDFPFSNEEFIDFRDATKNVFQDMGGVFTFKFVLPQDDGTPEQARVAQVTTNFFDLMGAKILYGRDFSSQDGLPQPPPPAPGTAPAGAAPPPRLPVMAILSYEYFQRRYGGNPAVIGKSIRTQAPRFSPVIVGVLAPGFKLYFPPEAQTEANPEVWVANRLNYDVKNRNSVSIRAVARLKDGVSLAAAQAAADNVAADARKNYRIEGTAGYAIRLEPMRKHLVSEVQPTILALMGAVIFLLLIACANVANLLLVRSSLRERELAVRAAMGASRWRLVRQMLAEAVMLAALGAAGGLALAWAGIRELLALAPANLPRMETIRIDAPVLVFTVIAALVAAAVFGMVSAWRASRPNVSMVLGGSSRNEGLTSGGLLRKLVVVIEVALCFVLLVGSGLMIRSFRDLEQINPGFDPQGLLTFQALGNLGGQTSASRAAAVREIQQRLQAIPGIQGVTGSALFPLAGGFSPIRWGNLDAGQDASKFQATDPNFVLPGYFEALHVPLIAGRTFTDDDNTPIADAVLQNPNPDFSKAGHNVVVIDQDLAKKAFPNGSAVGKQILIRIRTPQAESVEVIGVVAHTRDEALNVPGREQVYFTDSFIGSGNIGQWTIRTTGNPARYGNEIRATIKQFNPGLFVTDMETADELVGKAEAGTIFSLMLIGVFAVIAVLLAAVGLYGVLSTVVRQRTAEIGVRMALGAEPSRIFKLIVGQGLRLTAIGIVAGLIAALVLTRLMETMLVGVKATDPVTFVAMAILFFAIAGVASWLPAWRAASVDPNEALRQQ
ncbi:MAG TPA: ABC transporter permease [Candidatus Acidoferrales bacterium]|nr:ABC transporter permease [Candidatus Acidoferrales bacterium]